MLLRLIKNCFSRPTSANVKNTENLTPLEKANLFNQQGDSRSAIAEFYKHLEAVPHDVEALNNLGCCLVNIGNEDDAGRLFELAFSLDDSFLPVVVNHARYLNDRQRSEEGLAYLRQAKTYDPESPNVDAVYGSMALLRGDAELARNYSLRAWLGSFDNLRFANCYLFYCAYNDIDESELAAEHRFWAETLLPLTNYSDESLQEVSSIESLPISRGKIRIGYLSPDFRNHSVRYFFRPLLENHNREKFEVVIYHDFPVFDEQTECIKKAADHFFAVSELSDQKLVQLIRTHKLDVLVELAGQSSANRLNLLQGRLATLQVTALGYPPTTGLASIDGKLLDVHMVDGDSSRYYTEQPIVLRSSFWCFDPKEEVSIDPEPPTTRNGYITFACVGNIAKISSRILGCWAQIMKRVPQSRLLLRSISFNDMAAQACMRERLEAAGILLAQVDIHQPAAGKDYFKSYNDVDIILDTYPFNGGTTTCFATYMGVPVVTWAGSSLISRMGQSILNNLEMSDWVVSNAFEYVERAVRGAKDVLFLRQFRMEARERFSRTALGNGVVFAQDFEASCMAMLDAKRRGEFNSGHDVGTLPAQELLRRAYAVLRFGQYEPARRIVDYCLRAYPDCGAAHILWTQRLTADNRFDEAASYLLERLPRFSLSEQFASLVNVARFYLVLDRNSEAAEVIWQAESIATEDAYDHLQVRMLKACLQARNPECESPVLMSALPTPVHINALIVCDDELFFQSMRSQIEAHCHRPTGLEVNFIRCSEGRKGRDYSAAISQSDADVLLWVHKNIDIRSPSFFMDVILALEHCDLLGIAGARRWERMDWRLTEAENKVASFLVPSGEKVGGYEVQAMGVEVEQIAQGMCVLDGSLMAIRLSRLKEAVKIEFDTLLEGGATLMEEDVSHRAYLAGLRLAVHQSLGVVMDWRMPLLNDHLGEARWHLAQRLGFDPFLPQKEDRTIISVPAGSPEEGVAVQRLFLKG